MKITDLTLLEGHVGNAWELVNFPVPPLPFTVSSHLLRLYLITGLQYLAHLDGTC
jgi:hypothetical protein